jgi:penicillin-binding protein 1A
VKLLSQKGRAKKIAQTSARTFGGIIVLILKIIGTLLLIGVTTGVIFACIFAVYVKTNLTSELDVKLEDFRDMKLSSEIFYKDKESGEDIKLVTLQSSEFRKWVNYDQIPKNAEHALVAIEDKRFYDHHGVDWYRTVAAFGNMFLSMKDNFGGSTITQQLIKNLTDESEVTVQRKLLEIFRALQFEKEYSKEEIIEWYFNDVTFGGNAYGIGAAANYYFGKDVKDLTLAECASIIGITNNPSMYNPYINAKANKERQENILTEMRSQGYISEQEMDQAKAQKLVFVRGENEKNTTVIYTWFEEAVINDVIADLAVKKDVSPQVAENLLFTQGYKIICTLDPDLQYKVDSIYQNLDAIPKVTGSDKQIQSSIVLADPYTGEILALEGGVGQKTANRLLNRATQTRRPPGSSIKPLAVYAPAMERGLITPETRFLDSAEVKLAGTNWMPKNDDLQYSGVITIRQALVHSVNTVSAQIMDSLKPSNSFKFMKETLGFDLEDYDEDYAPLALGQLTRGATVREMASAYTMFDNNGVENRLITYSQVLEPDGKNGYSVLIDNKPVTSTAISPVTAYWITSMLQDAATSGTGYEANLKKLMPVAGKTGTTTDKKDRWFCGFTPYYVAVVWTGFDTPATMKVKGNPSAQLWNKVMKLVSEGQEFKNFAKPKDTYLTPVPGVDTAVPYVVRCVTVDGQELQKITDRTAMPGKDLTETAPEIEGYVVTGDASKTITVSKDPNNNMIEFYYQVAEPSPTPTDTIPTEEPTPTDTAEPTPTDTAEPPPTETPPPTESPSVSPMTP